MKRPICFIGILILTLSFSTIIYAVEIINVRLSLNGMPLNIPDQYGVAFIDDAVFILTGEKVIKRPMLFTEILLYLFKFYPSLLFAIKTLSKTWVFLSILIIKYFYRHIISYFPIYFNP